MYRFQHRFGVFEYIIVPKTNDSDAGTFKRFGSFVIIRPLGSVRVGAPVQFDGQECFVAVKVENEPSYRMLPPKLEATKAAVSQELPDQIFGIGLPRS
ncbi:hypothetical protein GPICK_11350 [Geobacter pickeringii]|uniref:Uncharacterized protein n=1 Tax=Geobacter pickeringii TaxID=345632 RepID=A0A0B5BIL5_9BACT|nr:hypothetical protein GPICK_11350 [Geobacter pickeringii]